MRDKKCFEWAAGAAAYHSLSFDSAQDDSGRKVEAGCCPTSEQGCLVGRLDLWDSSWNGAGFRSGFRLDNLDDIRSITYSHIDDRVIT